MNSLKKRHFLFQIKLTFFYSILVKKILFEKTIKEKKKSQIY